jgi:carbon storage regulator CsrA
MMLHQDVDQAWGRNRNMLMLSRRSTQKILFPNVGVTVSIVSVKGQRVQVGIEAPRSVAVVRGELIDEFSASTPTIVGPDTLTVDHSHELKNRINTAMLGVELAQMQLEAGDVDQAETTLRNALQKLKQLEGEIATVASDSDTQREVLVDQVQRIASKIQTRPNTHRVARILLVEDDLNESTLLRSLLEMKGYDVDVANDGNEAINRLDELKPDIVLLDMSMPNCDGPETIHRLRNTKRYADLPVFAVSGTSPYDLGLHQGDNGIVDWFPKPLDSKRLLRTLHDACN